MHTDKSIAYRKSQIGNSARGFTFTEVMFAIMVLGIGFIMIAAMFPVAIRQTQSNQEQTVAATIAPSAMNVLSNYHYDPAPASFELYQPTDDSLTSSQSGLACVADFQSNPPPWNTQSPLSVPFNTTEWPKLWSNIQGSLILPEDSRYAWIPLYSRHGGTIPDNFARLFVWAVQMRNLPTYTLPGQLAPHFIAGVTITHPAPVAGTVPAPDTIQFTTASTSSPDAREAVGPGCYVLVAQDLGPSSDHTLGAYNGAIFRIGNPATDSTGPNPPPNPLGDGYPTRWELMPNYFPSVGAGTTISCGVYVVGRGLVNDPNGPNYNSGSATYYDGPVQDVGLYASYVKLNF